MKSVLLVLVLAFAGCTSKKATKEDMELLKQAQGVFKSLPETMIDKDQNADRIELGKELYFEKKLAINNTISCNSCHNL